MRRFTPGEISGLSECPEWRSDEADYLMYRRTDGIPRAVERSLRRCNAFLCAHTDVTWLTAPSADAGSREDFGIPRNARKWSVCGVFSFFFVCRTYLFSVMTEEDNETQDQRECDASEARLSSQQFIRTEKKRGGGVRKQFSSRSASQCLPKVKAFHTTSLSSKPDIRGREMRNNRNMDPNWSRYHVHITRFFCAILRLACPGCG